MKFIWNEQTLLIGFIYGIVLMLGYFFFLVDDIIYDIQQEDVDDPSVNSKQFELLFKYGTTISIFVVAVLVLGPLSGGIYEWFVQQEMLFGISSVLVYSLIVLGISLTLDLAVFITKTPFPWKKVASNTWTFLVFGVLVPFVM